MAPEHTDAPATSARARRGGLTCRAAAPAGLRGGRARNPSDVRCRGLQEHSCAGERMRTVRCPCALRYTMVVLLPPSRPICVEADARESCVAAIGDEVYAWPSFCPMMCKHATRPPTCSRATSTALLQICAVIGRTGAAFKQGFTKLASAARLATRAQCTRGAARLHARRGVTDTVTALSVPLRSSPRVQCCTGAAGKGFLLAHEAPALQRGRPERFETAPVSDCAHRISPRRSLPGVKRLLWRAARSAHLAVSPAALHSDA